MIGSENVMKIMTNRYIRIASLIYSHVVVVFLIYISCFKSTDL